jgi:hypothetical protein
VFVMHPAKAPITKFATLITKNPQFLPFVGVSIGQL